MTQLVLVTGGSGFIAGHCILQLLEQGFEVRTTVRSLDREQSARAILTERQRQMTDPPFVFDAAKHDKRDIVLPASPANP